MQERKKHYGFIINQEKCLGCYTCVIACKMEHRLDKGSYIRLETEGGNAMDTPAGKYPELSMYFCPQGCMHCEKPACQEVCPVAAIIKREDGIVLIKEELCDGCGLCLDACPYGAIQFAPEGKVVAKCDMCVSRVDQGLLPFCVICCEGEAMIFGDVQDASAPVAEFLARHKVRVLSQDAGTAPAVFYHRK